MPYVCLKCRKEIEIEDKIRCPYCGFRILAKPRTPFRKRVISR
ncbi:MAG: DNA-directed RNA polymerase subunit P [Candidatus Aenigmatarchaeota archaeon]